MDLNDWKTFLERINKHENLLEVDLCGVDFQGLIDLLEELKAYREGKL